MIVKGRPSRREALEEIRDLAEELQRAKTPRESLEISNRLLTVSKTLEPMDENHPDAPQANGVFGYQRAASTV